MIGKRNQDGEPDSKEATNSQVEKGLTGKARGDSGEDGGKQTLKIGLPRTQQPTASKSERCGDLGLCHSAATAQSTNGTGTGHRDRVTRHERTYTHTYTHTQTHTYTHTEQSTSATAAANLALL